MLLGLTAIITLAGCATAPPSPFTAESGRTLRLDTVTVTVTVAVAPDAQLMWGNAEQEFVNQKKAAGPLPKNKDIETGALGLQDSHSVDTAANAELIKSPEGQAYLRERVTKRLAGALDNKVKAQMNSGTRAVVLDVTVHSFVIPSAIQRVLIGGAPTISASAVLKDAKTGEVLAQRPNMLAAAFAGNGWGGVLVDQVMDDLDVRVVDNYAEQYRQWLIPQG